MTAKKKGAGNTKGGALDNFFPDDASEAVEAAVSAGKGDRLSDVGSETEAVTVLPPAAEKVVAKAEVKAEVKGEGEGKCEVSEVDDLGVIPAVDETNGMVTDEIDEAVPEDSAQLGKGAVNYDALNVIEGESLEPSKDEMEPSPDKGDEPLPAEEVDEVPEKSDNEISEALEQNEERKSDILIGLGFNKYDDNDGKIKYSILEDGIKIGVTFDEKNKEGNVWAIYKESTADYKSGVTKEGKEGTFLSPIARSQLPLLQKYYAILKGEEPIPKPVVFGKVVEKRGGSIGIEFEEEVGGPRTEYYPATDAVKRDKEGHFIAKGFSKAWRDRPAKMHFPRAIRLPNYEQELKAAPVSEATGQQPSSTPDASGTAATSPSLEKKASKAPTVTLEEKREQISANMNWAVGEAVAAYKAHVEGQVPISGDLGVFIEKIAVTMFMTLQQSLKCVEG